VPGKLKPREVQAHHQKATRPGLAYPVEVERSYDADRKAMLAALRVVLEPRLVPAAGERGETNDGEDEGGSPIPASL
jgi:hypothetical protein